MSRRHAFKVLPAAVAACVATRPADAIPSQPSEADRDLLSLVAEWERVDVAEEEAAHSVSAALDRLEKPVVPDVLFYRSSDPVQTRYMNRYRLGNRSYFSPDNLDELRRIQALYALSPEEAGSRGLWWMGSRALQQMRDRLAELINALDAYQKAEMEAERGCGLTEAEDRMDRLSEESFDLRTRIVRMPATTVAGLVAKNKLLLRSYGLDWLEDNLHGDLEKYGPSRDVVARRLSIDLARIVESGLQIVA